MRRCWRTCFKFLWKERECWPNWINDLVHQIDLVIWCQEWRWDRSSSTSHLCIGRPNFALFGNRETSQFSSWKLNRWSAVEGTTKNIKTMNWADRNENARVTNDKMWMTGMSATEVSDYLLKRDGSWRTDSQGFHNLRWTHEKDMMMTSSTKKSSSITSSKKIVPLSTGMSSIITEIPFFAAVRAIWQTTMSLRCSSKNQFKGKYLWVMDLTCQFDGCPQKKFWLPQRRWGWHHHCWSWSTEGMWNMLGRSQRLWRYRDRIGILFPSYL